MKSKFLIGVVSLSLVACLGTADTAREQAILKKIKAQYKGLDAAMATMNPEKIVPFFAPKGIMIPKKGKPSLLEDAAIEMCSRFKKKKSATVRTYVKQFTLSPDVKTMTCMAKVKMKMILPLRGHATGESVVELESVTKDVWAYGKGGWLMAKSYAVSDKMKVDGKPWDPSKISKQKKDPVDDVTEAPKAKA